MPIYYKLSPELNDGHANCVVETEDELRGIIEDWIIEFGEIPGESFSVEVVEMTTEEFGKLPSN